MKSKRVISHESHELATLTAQLRHALPAMRKSLDSANTATERAIVQLRKSKVEIPEKRRLPSS